MSGTCGVWSCRRGLYAVVLDCDGLLALRGAVPDEDENQIAWLAKLEREVGGPLEMVLPEHLARAASLGRLAQLYQCQVWVAPDRLVASIRAVVWDRPSPRQLAAMLARLPRVRDLRVALRRMPGDDYRQLTLFDPLRLRRRT